MAVHLSAGHGGSRGRWLRALFLALVYGSALLLAVPHAAAEAREVRARHGMVVSDSHIASEVGVRILRQGGNAVDASVAVAFALAVTYPQAGNLGGGGFMMLLAPDGRAVAIDYRETAPQAATRDIYLDASGHLKKAEGSSVIGYRAPGVPGTVAGLALALKRHGSGRFTWAQLVEPARRLAADGFRVTPGLSQDLREKASTLRRYADANRIFLRNGRYFHAGEILRQPDLAATLARLQTAGPDDFYRGDIARRIAACVRRHDGLMTQGDLSAYVAKERQPIRGAYRGYGIISMPPPSSGGIVLVEMLNMLEGFDVGRMGPRSAARCHLLAEVMRRAFADRAACMGDTDFVSVPVARLISKRYAWQRRKDIDAHRASTSASVQAGTLVPEPPHTTHFTVIDVDGRAVSNTYTLNDIFGCGAVADGTGILLNNEMDDFSTHPGSPNMYGLIHGPNNDVAPGKRPLSAMTPTFVLRRDGRLWFAVGSPGGPTIINTVLQIVVHVIDDRMRLQQAVDAPRIHQQWLPDRLDYERGALTHGAERSLASSGYALHRRKGIGDAMAVMISPRDGMRIGASDPRAEGAAVGY